MKQKYRILDDGDYLQETLLLTALEAKDLQSQLPWGWRIERVR